MSYLKHQFKILRRKKYYKKIINPKEEQMYQYSFSDKESKEIENKTKSVDDVFKAFKDIDKKYEINLEDKSDSFNQSLELERKQFERPDEKEVEKQAQEGLSEYKNASLNQIENDYKTNKTAIDQQLETLDSSTKQSKSQLEEAYQSAKTNASNDAIKRGLARSSIIVNKLAEYDKNMLTEFSKIEKDYNDTFNKLNNQKSMLEVQRQNALDAFDIAYAVKLSEKISALNEKLDQKEQEVIEYNNKMEQLEKEFELERNEKLQDYQNDLNKQKLDNMKYYGEYGTNQLDMIKEKEKYDIAYEYLMSLPKDEAVSLLENNPDFRTNFKTYYNKLYSTMLTRR